MDVHAWVVGAGGLGCPALLGLTMAGVRRLTIVDHDRVEAHNLQRQVLFSIADVGAPKADAAAHALRRRVPQLSVQTRRVRLDPDGLDRLVAEAAADADADGRAAVVLECTDAPGLKFAANDAALRHDVPAVIAAALGWRGQAIAVDRGHACYRCVYEAPPPPAAVPTCAEAGVIGAGVGLLGFVAAQLAVRLGPGQRDACGRLHHLDLLTGNARVLAPAIRDQCPAHLGLPTASASQPARPIFP